MSVATFPADRASDREPRNCAPDGDALRLVRRCARRCEISPRFDLERLCACDEGGDAEFWGIALMQAASRARPLSFHRGPTAAATESECWLAGLLTALRKGDTSSARFIAERHLSQSTRRVALCFAQRLLAANSAQIAPRTAKACADSG
jgi:hypothetical protein